MAGQIKVDSINADSNLALKIANTAVAFIDSSGLRPVSGNVSLDATATSKVFLPSANTVAIQTAGVTGLSMSSSQVVTLTNALPVGSGGTGNTATPTAGGIIYGTGTVQAVTAAGTSGQYLQSNAASAPTWVTPSAGALTLISSATASSTALISFTGLTTSYRAYILEFDSVYMSVASEGLLLQFSTDNGGSYIASGYARTLIAQVSGTFSGNYSTTGTVLYLGGINGYSGASTQTGSGMLTIFAPATSGKNASTYVQASILNAGVLENSAGAQTNTTTSAVNAFKLFAGSGNIAGGNFRLYGLANA